MKKNRTLRIGVAVLALTMVSTCMLSGTFAKYTSKVSGTDSARVAKFAYTVKDQGNTTLESNTTLALFETVDAGVKDIVGDQKLVAPGTTGSFTVTASNTSEVKVDDTYAITYTNAGKVPIYFTFDGKNYSDVLTTKETNVIDGNMAALAEAISAKSTELAIDNGTASYPVTWAWDFEGKYTNQTDATDTTLGVTGTDTITFAIEATITQLDA